MWVHQHGLRLDHQPEAEYEKKKQKIAVDSDYERLNMGGSTFGGEEE